MDELLVKVRRVFVAHKDSKTMNNACRSIVVAMFILGLFQLPLQPVMTHAMPSTETPRVTFKRGSTNNASVTSLALADVNGDSRKDFILGAAYAPTSNPRYRTSVVFNTPNMPQVVDIDNLGSLGYEIIYPSQSNENIVGMSVVNAGDMNGDGREDILLYSLNQEISAQFANLLWGKADVAQIDVTNLASSQGVRFDATNPTNPLYLRAAMVGDMNGDGYPELAFGDFAWAEGNDNSRGKVRVIFGRSTWPASLNLDTLSQDNNGFDIIGNDTSLTGYSVAAAGDVNGDGLADMVLTVPADVRAGAPGQPEGASAAYAVFGSHNLGNVDLSSLGSQGFRMHSHFLIQHGANLSAVGDVNGDGRGDVAVSSDGTRVDSGMRESGRVWIMYGKSDVNEVDLDNLGAAGTMTVSATANEGFAANIATNSSSLLIGEQNVNGSNNVPYGGRIYGLPRSSLTASHIAPNIGVGYVIEGASPYINLGGVMANGDAGGEILASVGASSMTYMAAVLPARDAKVALPNEEVSLPIITSSINPVPNQAGWNNSNVTVTWSVEDALSTQGCSPTFVNNNTPLQGIEVTCSASNNAGSTSKAVTVKLDKTLPTTTNPAMSGIITLPFGLGSYLLGSTTNISANVADVLSGVTAAEYYFDNDPGQGNGTSLTITNSTATAMNVNVAGMHGQHTLYIRSRDVAGNWSPLATVEFRRL